MNRVRNNAFTLIELLVVIAIIAILAAILFPVFAQARESARIASCLSNMQQIGLGINMYSQDYDEYIPLNRAVDAQYIEGNWKDLIQPYIKNLQIFQCPSNPAAHSYDESGETPGNLTNPLYNPNLPKTMRGYFLYHPFFMSSAAVGSGDWWGGNQLTTVAFQYPANTLIIGENKDIYPDYGPWMTAVPNVGPNAWGPSGSNWGARHRGSDKGVNLTFMDGHAKFTQWDSTCTPSNGDGTNMWAYNRSNMNFGTFNLSWLDTFCSTLQTNEANGTFQ